MGLLHTAEPRRQVKLILLGVVSVELSLACMYLGEESYGGHFSAHNINISSDL